MGAAQTSGLAADQLLAALGRGTGGAGSDADGDPTGAPAPRDRGAKVRRVQAESCSTSDRSSGSERYKSSHTARPRAAGPAPVGGWVSGRLLILSWKTVFELN